MTLARSPVLNLSCATTGLLQLPLYLTEHVPQCPFALYPKLQNLSLPAMQC